MILNNLCMGCMREKPVRGMKCPRCGYDDTVQNNPIEMLPVWTILKGTYVVGKALGDGGFGITYTSFDLNLEKKIAIKEFFPYQRVYRDEDQKTVRPKSDNEEFYYDEKDKYVEEARILAQLDEQPGVVKVNTYFQENNTAYIAMEFLEGISLLQYVGEKKSNRLETEELFGLMKPVVAALAGIHAKGVIHMDISPDNIIVDAQGKAKLIDFGAAYDTHSGKEEFKVYKVAYSPIEQISTEGKVTAASDVYALCATMYYALTGTKPDSAAKRSIKDEMKRPSELGVDIDLLREEALMLGFSVKQEDRIRNAADLYHFLYLYHKESDASVADMKQKVSAGNRLVHEIEKEKKRDRIRRNVVLISIALLLIVLAYWLFRAMLHQRPMVSIDTSLRSEQIGSTAQENHGGPDVLGWRDALYEKIGTAQDETLEQAANEMTSAYVAKSLKSTEEWNQYFSTVADETISKYGMENVGWLVLPYHVDTDINQIISDAEQNLAEINAGVEKAVDLYHAGRIGISVGIHSDGTVFVVILYGV